jgi:Flp pilus assembly protein TadG
MLRRHVRGETTVQIVLLVPVIFVLLLVGVHVASFMHASNVANAAAKRGAQVAAGVPDSAQASLAATTSVSEMVRELGSTLRASPSVSFTRSSVTVSVSLRINRLLPFLPDTVSRRGMARQEIFRTEAQR